MLVNIILIYQNYQLISLLVVIVMNKEASVTQILSYSEKKKLSICVFQLQIKYCYYQNVVFRYVTRTSKMVKISKNNSNFVVCSLQRRTVSRLSRCVQKTKTEHISYSYFSVVHSTNIMNENIFIGRVFYVLLYVIISYNMRT